MGQFCFGLVALGHQLHALGVVDKPFIPTSCSLAEQLTSIYERMGNVIAVQYSGSMAHNKMAHISSQKETGLLQSLVSGTSTLQTTVKRYVSQSFTDGQKQDSMDVFLGLQLTQASTGARPHDAAGVQVAVRHPSSFAVHGMGGLQSSTRRHDFTIEGRGIGFCLTRSASSRPKRMLRSLSFR